MNSQELFCPNEECVAKGQVGKGNIYIHSRKESRYQCKECGKTFSQRTGTPFYRLRSTEELFVRVVTLLSHGCPVQAIVAAFCLDERTVADWQQRAGLHCQKVHEEMVEQASLAGEVQADELGVKAQRAILWLASSIHVATRLWLGGEISKSRDNSLIRRMLERVKRSLDANGWVVLCTDGLKSYVSQTRRVFREKEHSGKVGRPRFVQRAKLALAQVVKRYEKRRVIDVERRVLIGTTEEVEATRYKAKEEGVINTAYIERHNATLRQRLAALARRTRCLIEQSKQLEAGMWMVGTIYNFCTPHRSVRVELAQCEKGASHYQERTPAMAAGLTGHIWTVRELMWRKVKPKTWQPPKKRGRPSKALKGAIERWAIA